MNNDINLKNYAANKLKSLRDKNNMTQDELADKISSYLDKEVKRQTISLYENGDRGMNQDILFALSDIFNVSVDTFFPSKEKDILICEYDGNLIWKTTFGETLQLLLVYNEINLETFSTNVHINIERIKMFLDKNEIPNNEELKKIADFFSIKNAGDLFNRNTFYDILQKLTERSMNYIKNMNMSFKYDVPLNENDNKKSLSSYNSENKDKSFDEFELLFYKNKDILTEEDKEYMKFIIEKRKKEIDKQLNEK